MKMLNAKPKPPMDKPKGGKKCMYLGVGTLAMLIALTGCADRSGSSARSGFAFNGGLGTTEQLSGRTGLWAGITYPAPVPIVAPEPLIFAPPAAPGSFMQGNKVVTPVERAKGW